MGNPRLPVLPGNVARDVRTLLEAYYGLQLRTRPRESDVTVGTTAVGLGQFPRSRLAIYISNNGANAIFIGFGSTVAVNTGIQVPANGFTSLTWIPDNELLIQDMFAISSAAGNGVHVIESVVEGAP